MSLVEQKRNFRADVERDVRDYIIKDYERKMPIRLIDTYTGLILKRTEISSLLEDRKEFRDRIDDVVDGTSGSLPFGLPSQDHSNFAHLEAFIAEYLAFAMFSHRWGNREMIISDVREATHGIYSIAQAPRHLSGKQATDFLEGAKKLQEFCCVAAKCGYRWAWSDTCCIDDQVYGEKSESLNSMFLWYRSSDLTIVYLGDVEDVDEGRFSPQDSNNVDLPDPLFGDPEIQNPFPSSYPYPPNTSSVKTLHHCSQETPRRFQTLRPDTQVETWNLEDLLRRKFPDVPEWIVRRIYYGLPAWVTRGWTLQEMLASKRLRFYSKGWTLLEEADDRDTDEAEKMYAISSFKYRARMLDHRKSFIWRKALHDTTGVPEEDLVGFEPGLKNIRERLRWAARRRTEKVEDMAYCLLGIFDVTLAAMYGEGHRAFFRLQEELMKRTGDTSLFDWCGPRSSVNSFLAHKPECFVEPNHQGPHFDDWSGSTLRMILDLLCAVLGTTLTGISAVIHEALDWVRRVVTSTPPGHALINGELNLSVFEHQVKSCEHVQSSSEDTYHRYRLEAYGLKPTHVTLESRSPNLENSPKDYYLCRVWNQEAHTVFRILIEMIEYVLKDAYKGFMDSKITGGSADSGSGHGHPETEDEPDEPDPKLRVELATKRKQVLAFFDHSFPVYLVRVRDGRRVRVSTVHRVLSDYAKGTLSMPVMTRSIL